VVVDAPAGLGGVSMKSELAETGTLAGLGAVLELQHADGSRAFLKLAELVNSPNTLRAIWPSVAGVRNPAAMGEQLIDGAVDQLTGEIR
jgi:hypothetical protein